MQPQKINSKTNSPASLNGSYSENLESDSIKNAADQQATGSPEVSSPDVILTMRTGLFNHGRTRAMQSGVFTPSSKDIEDLTAHGEAMANEVACDLFDEEKYEHDRLRKLEFEEEKQNRQELKQAITHSRADIREREDDLARANSAASKPVPPTLLMVTAGFVLAITVVPTMHDFIYITLSDDLLNWFLSLVSACLIGLFVTTSILGDIDSTGKRTSASWLGLIGGVVMFVGFGILRIAKAADWGEILFASALTIVELGIIGLLEWRAAALRDAYRDWSAKQAEVAGKKALLEAANANHARLENLFNRSQKAIITHINLVESRSIRHFNIAAIVAAAKKSILDGYNAGIAFNRGRAFGAGQSTNN